MENTLGLEEDVREIEMLVYQVKYLIETAPSVEYVIPIIKNLTKELLNLLRVEISDIKYVFKHEKKSDSVRPFVYKKRLSILHKSIKQGNVLKIKKEILNILNKCNLALKEKISLRKLRKSVHESCSSILKEIKSENYELGLFKFLLKPVKQKKKKRARQRKKK
jgi:hypothetical protein